MAKAAKAAEPEDDALRTDREAEAKLDTVTAPVATVTRIRRKGPKPPAGLGDPIIEFGAKLKVISIGKPIANVNTTLVFDLDIPQPGISELMGEHAYTGVFAGGLLGEGVFIKEAPRKVDSDNRVVEQIKVTLPRFDSAQVDQIERCILPLLGDKDTIAPLLSAFDGSWRLNCPVDIPGVFRLHVMQQSFDLTKQATTEAEDAAAAGTVVEPFADPTV